MLDTKRTLAEVDKSGRNSSPERLCGGELSPALRPLRREVAEPGRGEDQVRESGRRWATWQWPSDDVRKEQCWNREVLHEVAR